MGPGYSPNSVSVADGIAAVKEIADSSIHLILSDIPYGIGIDEWDVLHSNTNSAFLGTSPAQVKAGAVFKRRGKPLNGWSEADRQIPLEYQRWCASFASEWLRVLKPGGSALVFAGRRLSHRCVIAFEDAGFTFRDSLAWLRESAPHRAQRLSIVFERRGDPESAAKWEGWRIGNLRPTFEPILWFVKPYPIGTTIADNMLAHGVGAFNEKAFVAHERTPDNVLRSGFGRGESGLHVAQKPAKLLQALIELTTQRAQVVLDPFCGSGSTLVAAKASGRRYVGFDIDADAVKVAQERLAPDMFDLLQERAEHGT
ncbi:MAG: site-specific DNA-methyltransferase [Deltaproteobacteria bacterium]|nr:site-specific DNA-methyltransferase [Deltaproteobacteria bacterium]